MADRYANIWEGHEELLENAKNVAIMECSDCKVEWNSIMDPNVALPIQDDICPECGQPGLVTSPM